MDCKNSVNQFKSYQQEIYHQNDFSGSRWSTYYGKDIGYDNYSVVATKQNKDLVSKMLRESSGGLLNINVREESAMGSLLDPALWHEAMEKIYALGGKRTNGGLGWIEVSFETEEKAKEAEQVVGKIIPDWIILSYFGKKVTVWDRTPGLGIEMKLNEACISKMILENGYPKLANTDSNGDTPSTANMLIGLKLVEPQRRTKIIQELAYALKDKNPEIRKAAAIAPRYHGFKVSTYPLISSAKSDADAKVRSNAIESLALLYFSEKPRNRSNDFNAVVSALIICLKDKDADVRKSASNALGILGDKSALQPLLNAFNKESSVVARSGMIDSIKKLNR